jgi:hypothetical protein
MVGRIWRRRAILPVSVIPEGLVPPDPSSSWIERPAATAPWRRAAADAPPPLRRAAEWPRFAPKFGDFELISINCAARGRL